MKKICYGESNFPYVICSNGYYVDKSMFIEKLEKLGAEYLFFLRPRRFGKSLFVSMLEAYYDINTADQFDEFFGDLYIGKNPTPLRNKYSILKLNFSRIRGRSTLESMESAFDSNVLSSIETFYKTYPEQTGGIATFARDIGCLEKADIMLDRFLYKMEQINLRFYLLIDEYDNLANNILADRGKESYYNLTHGTGFLRSFFAIIKAGTDNKTIARMFATGVSPLVLSDVTSGFNIGVNISTSDKFHNLVGFNEQDVGEIVNYFIAQGLVCESIKEPLLSTMKKYYDGYRFSPNIQDTLYNSTLVLHLLQQYEISLATQNNQLPRKIIDSNLMTDYTKLEFLIIEKQLQDESLTLHDASTPKLNGNYNYLSDLLLKEECQGELIDNFSVNELMQGDQFTSLLYYLGLITIKDQDLLTTTFAVPNESCRHMLWEYIRTTLSSMLNINFVRLAALFGDFARKGLWRPYFEKIFENAYTALSNRDFIDRESVIKGILAGYLTQINYYIIRSEKELNKGYTDLYLEPIENLALKLNPTHYLIELKYLSTGDVSEESKQKQITTAKAEATKQLNSYEKGLNLKVVPLKKLIIIADNKGLLLLEEA